MDQARSGRWLLLSAAALAVATDVIYLVIIGGQAREPFDIPGFERVERLFQDQTLSPYTSRVITFGTLIGLAALAIGVAAWMGGQVQIAFGWFGVGLLLPLGVLGIMTIGIPLIVAAGLASAGLLPALNGGGRRYVLAGSAGAVALAAVTLMMFVT